jgi:hypothetical protein
VHAVFVPLRALQRALGLAGRANTLLAAAKGEAATVALEEAVGGSVGLEDLGLRVRTLPAAGALQLETTSALVDERLAAEAIAVAREQGLAITEALVYLANAIQVGDRAVPYSLVAALDDAALSQLVTRGRAVAAEPPIVLNDWAAAALHARPGDRVTLEYYLWRDEGRLDTGSSAFTLAGVTPIAGLAADRDLVPGYPGITESLRLADWEPPFPVDLARIRPADEAYWVRYRTTPKAFVPLEAGQRLWGQPQGRLTSLRLVPPSSVALEDARRGFADALLARLRPTVGRASTRAHSGRSARNCRARGTPWARRTS